MRRTFDIGGRPVGDGAPCFLIAELSANHGGRLDVALATIEAAKKAGADAIKLQTYTPDTLTLKSDAPHFVVKTKNAWAGRTLHDLYAEAMTPWEWHKQLKDAAEALGMPLFSTPFDPTAVEFLEQLDVPCHKIASFEIVDLPLVEHVARRGKPMIISTGMARLADIEAALDVCREAGNDRVIVLRCVSSYPADPAAMDLKSYEVLRELGCVIGLSDHTRDHTVAIASVALGAKVIEKHFILDRSVGGPDSFFSLEPAEFRAMTDVVRTTEAALGKVRFGPGPDEKASVAFRRSLFVAEDVAPGELLHARNVRSVRPSNGLPARHLPEVLGRRATRALKLGEPLEWSMVGELVPVPEVTLRPATSDDAAFLLALRNDVDVRNASLSTAMVEPHEHAAWLGRALAEGGRKLYVAERGGKAVGQVRLDARGPAAFEISISVDKTARKGGVGRAMLRAAEREAVGLGAARLEAVIKVDNEASIRTFEAAGYHAFVRPPSEVPIFRCERRIARY